MKSKCLYLIFSIILFNCKEEKKYSIKPIAHFSKDSLKIGEYIEYYDNGSVSFKANFEENKKQGWAYYYYPNNQLQGKVYYQNGVKIGVSEFYHINGVLKAYICYYAFNTEFEEEVFYRADYNNEGTLTKESGEYLPSAIISSDSISVNNNFWIEFYIARPPHLECNIFLNGNVKSENYRKVEIKNSSSFYLFENKYKNPGNYKISFAYQYQSKNKFYMTDTLDIDLNVY